MRSTAYYLEPNDMRKILALIALASLPFIHGCGLFVVGAAAGSGYLLGEDRRPVGTMSDDERIELRITDAMKPIHHHVRCLT